MTPVRRDLLQALQVVARRPETQSEPSAALETQGEPSAALQAA